LRDLPAGSRLSQHVGEHYVLPGARGARTDQPVARLARAPRGETENFELAAELRDRIRVLE
jgi:protein-arginine kinase activator protein McsA